MKKCMNCGKSYSDDLAVFCPFCGAVYPVRDTSEAENEILQRDSQNQVVPSEKEQSIPKNSSETVKVIKGAASNVAQKVNNNAFVNAVRMDLHNSTAIQTVKNSVAHTSTKARSDESVAENRKSGGKGKKIVAIVLSVVVVIGLTLGLGLHRCEDCDEIYFGKQHKISFFGETEKVCKDCYDDFHSFW